MLVSADLEGSRMSLPFGTPVPNPLGLAYITRLSDHLFVLARLVAKDRGGDILWKPGATRDPG